MKTYLHALLVCIAAVLIPTFTNTPIDESFFAYNSYYAVIVILWLLILGVNKYIIAICGIELTLLFLYLFAAYGMEGDYHFYRYYEIYWVLLNSVEAIVLLKWTPTDAIYTRFSNGISTFRNHILSWYNRIQYNHIYNLYVQTFKKYSDKIIPMDKG